MNRRDHHRRCWLRTIVAAIWAGMMAGCSGGTASADPADWIDLPAIIAEHVTPWPAAPPPECYEDQPCWDCTTMGNRQCGPPPTPPPWTGPTCYGQPVPADPRVTVADPIGSLIYFELLRRICGPTPTEAP